MKTEEELTKDQAEAWCQLVSELMMDYGLDWKEPGEIMLEQVQNFLHRKFKEFNAAEKLCRVYFDIAADAIQRTRGCSRDYAESVVRQKRDEMVAELIKQPPEHSPTAEKSDPSG
jgi:hypothetical protein